MLLCCFIAIPLAVQGGHYSPFVFRTARHGSFAKSIVWCRVVSCTEQGGCWMVLAAKCRRRDVASGSPWVMGIFDSGALECRDLHDACLDVYSITLSL